jgi:hypothetical protein
VSRLSVFVLLFAGLSNAVTTIPINEERGEYELNPLAVYELPLANDIQTVITLPSGYTLTWTQPGSVDFIAASQIQNAAYVSKTVDHSIETDLILHVTTPLNVEQKIVFRCTGAVKGQKVYAVHLTQPNTSEINRVVESMRIRYTDQLNNKLTDEEKRLSAVIHDETMINERNFFISSSRKSNKKEYKGATVYIDGIANSRNSTFIHAIANVNDSLCGIIQLLKVIGPDKQELTPRAMQTIQMPGKRNEFYYTWELPKILIPSKKKPIVY